MKIATQSMHLYNPDEGIVSLVPLNICRTNARELASSIEAVTSTAEHLINQTVAGDNPQGVIMASIGIAIERHAASNKGSFERKGSYAHNDATASAAIIILQRDWAYHPEFIMVMSKNHSMLGDLYQALDL